MIEIPKYQIKRFCLSIIPSTFLLKIFSSAAFAACVTNDGGITYTCSGTTTTAQVLPASISGSTVTIIDSTFLNSPTVTGNAVRVNATATGDISVTQAQGATLSSNNGSGIYVTRPTATAGMFSVSSAGSITATGTLIPRVVLESKTQRVPLDR
jgi:hypothetical protein